MVGTPRWRVAIVDDHDQSRAELRAAVMAAGGDVVGETARAGEALALVRRVTPDVVITAVGLPDGDGLAVATEASRGGCPVVLLTSHTAPDVIERARAAGVMAYLLKPLRTAELAPALDVAIARYQEARTLSRRLDERKVIERAKGLLMQRHGLTEDEAFRRLRRTAMDHRTPMVDIARSLLVSESISADVITR